MSAADLWKSFPWQAGRGPRERAFVRQIGRWPKVWKIEKNSTVSYELTAIHSSPNGLKEARTIAVGAAVLAALWLASALTPPGATGGPLFVAFLIAGVAGMMLFAVIHPVLRLLNPWLGRPLRMSFNGRAVEWKGNRRTWRGGYQMEKVFPDDERTVRVMPHRKAAEELRKAQEAVRKRKKEPRMFYQQATEVLMGVGPQFATSMHIAEIANDEHGQRGGELKRGIDMAMEAAAGQKPANPNPASARSGLYD